MQAIRATVKFARALPAFVALAAGTLLSTAAAANAEAAQSITVQVDTPASQYSPAQGMMLDRGLADLRAGRNEAAIDAFNDVLKVNPSEAVAYGNRGAARLALGDLTGALADFDQALKLDRTLGFVYYNRGVAHRRQGDRRAAMTDFRQAAGLLENEVAQRKVQQAIVALEKQLPIGAAAAQ
jgi:tetratricopeptide (TPR) repeat protein